MKNLIVFIMALLVTTTIVAQDKGFNYKAVISNNGAVLQNQAVQVQFTILNNGEVMEYQETHSSTTDTNGIIVLNIGEGTAVSGLFNSIRWHNSQFLKVEIDTGEGYEDFGTSEFKTVPYAVYAENGNGAKKLNDLTDVNSDITSLYLGDESGESETDSNLDNTAVGHFSLKNNLTGRGNNAIGAFSLYLNTTGRYNTAIGYQTLKGNYVGSNNTVLGHNAGFRSTGSGNIFLGCYAGLNETGSNKLYIENSNSSTPLIGGDFSTDEVTINGSLAVIDGTEGLGKVLISDANGKASWETLTETTQINDLSDAVFDGSSLYLGHHSGMNDDNSNYNVAVGWETMKLNTSGRQNASLGAESLVKNTTGSYNVSIGTATMYQNLVGSNNTTIGQKAGFNCLGDGNIFLGYLAGFSETGSDKLYIENSNSSTPLIGGDFSTDEVTINGSIEITGNVKGRITAETSGNSDMKAYIYGSLYANGETKINPSSEGFSSTKIATGHYRITFDTSLGSEEAYTLIASVSNTTSPQIITYYQTSHYFDIYTWDLSGSLVNSVFNFVVYKR